MTSAPQETESWGGSYASTHRDLVHAIGMISLRYNFLEITLRGFYSPWLGNQEVAAFLFEKTSNDMRLTTIGRYLDGSTMHDDIKVACRYFLCGFERNATNRNIIMHSWVTLLTEAPDGEDRYSLAFNKNKKDQPLQTNAFFADLPRLRGISDSMKAFGTYGVNVRKAWAASLNPNQDSPPAPLPEKPELPKILETGFPRNPEKSFGPFHALGE